MNNLPLSLATLLLSTATAFSTTTPHTAPGDQIQQRAGISFTENKGQVCDQNYKPRRDILYGAMAGNMAVHIKNAGVSYQLSRVDKHKTIDPASPEGRDLNTIQPRQEVTQQTIYRIDLSWVKHNSNFTASEDEALPGYNNYYLESCPNGALNVRSYKGVTLNNLYNGIDLHYYEKNGELKHDYIVAPRANYKQIQLKVEGAGIRVNNDGSLVLTTPLGQIQEGAPIVYQHGKQLSAYWKVIGQVLSFEIENYNPNYELIIDPVTRLWGTYYGSPTEEIISSIATDASGNVFASGYSSGPTTTLIATVGSHQTSYGGNFMDACLTKFDPSGTRLWGTYYGGSGNETANCCTDVNGNVYIAGYTDSNSGTVMATPGSHQQTFGGGFNAYDAYLVKFNGSGVRLWGTYYGGTGSDYGHTCATDPSGNVYLGGLTYSPGSVMTTPGAHQTLGGNPCAFLVKFNSSGARQWGTFYGVTTTYGRKCVTDISGNVYLVGETTAFSGTLIATPGSHQTSTGGGDDGFVVKFSSAGVRIWGTFYGGPGGDYIRGCTTDPSGNVYISGETNTGTGTGIATALAHQSTAGGAWDGFLVKFNAAGTRQWGTYYGGSTNEGGYACAADGVGNVFLAGNSYSSTGTVIATIGSHQTVYGGGTCDGFLAKFDAGGVRQNGTYYGSTGTDEGYSCATDPWGMVYLAGSASQGTGNPLGSAGTHQPLYGGGNLDGYLAKFDMCNVAPAAPVIGPATACAADTTVFNTPLGTGVSTYTWSLPIGWTGASTNHTIAAKPGSSGVFTLMAGNVCGTAQQTLSVTVNPSPTVTVNSGTICQGESFTIVPSGGVSYTYSAGPVIVTNITGTYTVVGVNSFGCPDTDAGTLTVHALPQVSLNTGAICIGQSFTLAGSGASSYAYPVGPVVSPIVTTTYSVIGASALGCTNTALGTVIVNPLPVVSVNNGSICTGKSFTIVASGASTYNYSGGQVVSPTVNTSYSVTGVSAFGCVSSNTAVSSVTVKPLPTIITSINPTLICAGEEATLTAIGALTYTFDSAGVGTSATVSPGTTTNYTITGVDGNGCSNTAIITLNVNDCVGLNENHGGKTVIKIFPNPVDDMLNLEMDVTNEITLTNAIGQVVYSAVLDEGVHQICMEHLAAGVYMVKVTNETHAEIHKVIKE